MTLPADVVAAVDEFLALDGPLIIASDFDGVLAPLVDNPADSRMIDGSASALTRLVQAAPERVRVALVSGRKLDELALLAKPAPGTLLFGTHGAETGLVNANGEVEAQGTMLTAEQDHILAGLRARAQDVAEHVDGAWVEEKATSVVLHTRLSPPAEAQRIVAEFTEYANAGDAHVMAGHDVVEVSVVRASKGDAVSQLRHSIDAAGVFYMGDDVTDETVFSVLKRHDVGIKIGAGSTAARLRLPDPYNASLILCHIADKVNADL
ncbi:trehalose-phosphatase [Timonella sp. A28]|uniref:trehalose-phosphatase n=1 Tax=Timonella sp. A28 TaxID=3442640 RepID=UPI003EBBACB1